MGAGQDSEGEDRSGVPGHISCIEDFCHHTEIVKNFTVCHCGKTKTAGRSTKKN